MNLDLYALSPTRIAGTCCHSAARPRFRTGGITLSSTMRYMTGAPMTIYDSSIDADRNGELVDPVPAGTYSGTAPLDAMKGVE